VSKPGYFFPDPREVVREKKSQVRPNLEYEFLFKKVHEKIPKHGKRYDQNRMREEQPVCDTKREGDVKENDIRKLSR
jgi:hypothetical protein